MCVASCSGHLNTHDAKFIIPMNGKQDAQSELEFAKHEKAKRKLSLLELAQDINNISKACRMLGYSRQHYYEIKRNYEALGFTGLFDQQPGAKHPHPNRVDVQTEEHILEHALNFPLHGPNTVAQSLNCCDHKISSGGVRGVFSRHNLLHKDERIERLESAVVQRSINPTEEQITLLEEHSSEFRERHVSANQSGEFVAIDYFQLSGVASSERLYIFTAMDCFSHFAIAQLYLSRSTETLIEFFQDCVLSAFQAHGIRINAVLDNNIHALAHQNHKGLFDGFLQFEDIELNPLPQKNRSGNGYSDTFRLILLQEFMISDTLRSITPLDNTRRELANCITRYNQKRVITCGPYSGRTPYDVFRIKFASNKE